MSTADLRRDLDATFEELMKFSAEERLELSERLYQSAVPTGIDRSDDDWKQEIERRVNEYEADPSSVVSAEDVDRHVRERIEEERRLQDTSRG